MANTKGTSVISNPSGGGAQSGLGEKFSPDLFTGTGNFSVPIAVPPGRNGFQPELSLGYSSGNGNGIFGLGWALGIPGVNRKTSKGIPIYDNKSDIFILSGAEDLVPVKIETEITGTGPNKISIEKTQYRPRTEGLFARITRIKTSYGQHYWEVRSKDGLISYYGTEGAAGNDPCVTANPEKRDSIFSWHLSKTVDPFGNVIVYEYDRDLILDPAKRSYDQLYPKTIKYCQYPDGDETKYLCEIRFVYEDRPDPFSAYKQGFETRITKRCVKIETYTHALQEIKTKTYHFRYHEKLPLNGSSMLASVTVEGHNGTESEFMPPLEFAYSPYNPAKRELQEIKGPLPVMFLSEPGFELVDVTGNGLPDLLQLDGSSRYWTNKGNGEFSQPRPLNIAPSVRLGDPGVQMIDANGDGRSDLMVNNGTMAGYFPGAFRSVWDSNSFKPYKQVPSFSFADPEVQLIDLDGDGITDVLRNGSKFECFYNHPEKGFHQVRTAQKKFTDFSFADPRIRFADMTGDGLQDIVLISSGRVQYWPNMGYGRFGAKVNMKNAPRFPEQYNPAQVLLGDLDGDGQSDIAFVENNSVTLYVNQSGNSFSEPVKIMNTPVVRDMNAIRITDIMGTGQAGILWTFGGGTSTPGRMFFLDFTKGNKPYVLEEMNNNMGSITRVKYGSSIYHYMRDEKDSKTRWKTDLPFPVQVVNKVEVLDLLSGGKLVTEYKYHNGYWDGVEREFRGFAHVDSIDTESFEKFNTQELFEDTVANVGASAEVEVNTVKVEHYSPPTMTKSWFYVGPVGDGFSRWHEPDFSKEYWQQDQNILVRPKETNELLASLPRRARRDALRTLRGTMLRSELYALDGSAIQAKPYTVTESQMGLRKEFDPAQLPDPLWNEKSGYWAGGGYVFFPFNIGQRTSQYERGNDPMHSFSFTKEYDNYGQALGQLSVGVPRGHVPAAQLSVDTSKYIGDKYLATFSLSEYIYSDSATTPYMVNRVKRSLTWDISQSSGGKSVFQLRDELFGQYDDDPMAITYPVIGCTINYYDWDGTTPGLFRGLDYGKIGDYGAQVRSETLILTTDILNEAYGTGNHPQCFQSSPTWNTGNGYPGTFAGAMQDSSGRMGYKDRRSGFPEHVPGWYAESPRIKYDFQDSGLDPEEQLGRVLETRDVFESWSSVEYDDYYTMPVKSRQYLYPYNGSGGELITEAEYDYRVMQPFKVIDPNENINEFDFSPLGLLRATALIGKGSEGDYKSGSGGFYERYEPSVRMEYDFFAFKNDGDPVWVKTISREEHYVDSAASDTIIKVEYSDGFGRLLQTRVQAEDVIFGNQTFGTSGLPAQQGQNANAVGIQRGGSDPLNVVVSGWKIYNNKGKVVEQYEPFFDKGFDYLLPDLNGVKIKMFYDPLQRVIRTVNPDKSEQRVVYGIPNALNTPGSFAPTPWENYSYDAADLEKITHPSVIPKAYHYTPKSALVDALARTIRTTEHIDKTNTPPTDNLVVKYFYDIRGNLTLVKDPYNRNVFEHVYDLRPAQKGEDGETQPLPPLKTKHLDKGTSRILFDAAGKPIESKDAKEAIALSSYDLLSRPVNAWAQNDGNATITLRQYMIYGDSAGFTSPPASDYNLNGQLYAHYDEAGKTEIPLYDFKGNVLNKTRKVVSSASLESELDNYNSFLIDWTNLPSILDTTTVFETDMEYDALNRITKLTLPEDLDTERKEIIPYYNRAGALEKVDLNSTVLGDVTYVNHIAYNAKGQRLMIAYGNDVMTRYVYDPLTFRLLRQRSEKHTVNTSGNTVTYTYTSGTNRQDDGFNFDLVGNILNILIRITDCGIGGTPDELDRTFEYDALNRLTYANGREADTQSGNSYLYDDAPDPGAPHPGNVRSYEREYNYDKLGNVSQVKQFGTNGFTRKFVYNAGVNTLERINDVSNALIEDYTYDSNGNQVTAGSTRNYSWNHADQLVCYKNQAGTSDPTVFTQYDYDAGGKRVSKLVRTGTAANPIYERTIYIDGIFEYVTLDDGSNPVYTKNYIHIMDDKSRIAEVRINPGTAFPGDITDDITYHLEDQIGSSVIRLNTSGAIIDEEEYYPFGDSSLRTFAYKRYRYVGKERDGESGLYYYGARYYAAWTCRFISVDPLAGDYPFYTPYNYAGNKPINKIDLDGLQELDILLDGTEDPGAGGGGGVDSASGPDNVDSGNANTSDAGQPIVNNLETNGISQTPSNTPNYNGQLSQVNKSDSGSPLNKNKITRQPLDSRSTNITLTPPPSPTESSIQLEPKQITQIPYITSDPEIRSNSAAPSDSMIISSDSTASGISAISIAKDIVNSSGIALGAQNEIMTYAVAQNYKSANNSWTFHSQLKKSQQVWRTNRTLGKVGSKLLKTSKVLGVVGSFASIGLTSYEIYEKGEASTRDIMDISVAAAGILAVVFFASNPIGWIVGAVAIGYAIGTTIYDASKK